MAGTAAGTKQLLRIAVNYSSRDAMLAAGRLGPDATREAFDQLLAPDGSGEVDLLIRTGGDKRLSSFLLWEVAYAELHVTDRQWPNFGGRLAAALANFHCRDRRFGGLTPLVVVAA